MENKNIRTIGFWAAWFSAFFGFGYSVPQLLSAMKIIPHPQDLFWLFLPSLFLAPAFVITMICLHYVANPTLKIWTAIGCSFAVVYCMMVTMVYFTQLAVVLPHELKGELEPTNVLLFEQKTFLTAVDCLGYFFMSLSSFFAAFAFYKLENKWLYRGLLYNGVLMPLLVLAFFYPFFYYIGAVWMITFPLAMINAAKYFASKSEAGFRISLEYQREHERVSHPI